MTPAVVEILKLAGSVAAILFLAWFARKLGLGGDVRIRSEEQARAIADEIICGFDPVDIAIDKAGIGALMRDAQGRHLLVRRHGAHFAGRLLDNHSETRLDQNFLTVGTGERTFGRVTLNLVKKRNIGPRASGIYAHDRKTVQPCRLCRSLLHPARHSGNAVGSPECA